MKRTIIILMLAACTVITVSAQNRDFKGSYQLNAGFGLSGWGIPVYAGMDFGVARDVTVGFEGSIRSYGQSFTGTHYSSTIVGLAGNGNYHFNTLLDIPAKWDFYAGLNIGFYFWSSPAGYPGSGSSGLGLGAQIGGRYFFTERFGLNLELGAGNTVYGGKFGITYRFR
jgi:hypothetical protein